MKTTQQGLAAEAAVADELNREGFKILTQNWRMKSCEIDIVAHKAEIAYLVEVKYRSSDAQGDGFSYITPTKLKQMKFAASIWTQFNNWRGDYRLMAAAVDGKTGEIDIIEVD